MLLFGAGGHAKVVISCIIANGETVRAVFDDDLFKTHISKISVSGNYDPTLFPDELLIVAIGDNKIRRLITQKIQHNFGKIIHPTAVVEEGVLIHNGSVVLHGSIIQMGTNIGNHTIINTRVSVDHDCLIGDYVHLAPGVTLCGNVQVGENTLVGAGSVVTPNITIGSNCLIAAGTIITKNIPNGSLVRGNPGRIIKYVQ